MMRRVLLIAVLGALCVAVYTTPNGQFRTPTKVTTTCCKEVSRAMIPNIRSYKPQHAQPPCMEAIVFTTVNGKQYCTDPKAQWVAKKIKALKQQ